jgi:hypothetical protein
VVREDSFKPLQVNIKLASPMSIGRVVWVARDDTMRYLEPYIMPAPRKRPKKGEEFKLFLRVPGEFVQHLDKWLDELNAASPMRQLARADLLRAILDKAVRERWGAP